MPVFFETKADLGSNKTGKVAVQLIATAYSYKRPTGFRVYVLKPSIDRLSFTYPVPTTAQRKKIREWLLSQSKKPNSLISHWKKIKDWGAAAYTYAFAVNCNAGAKILLQIESTKKQNAFMRVELNPSSVGPVGMSDFQSMFADMSNGEITYVDIAESCKVTRFDVAVDLVNVDVEDLLIKTQKPGKTMSYFSFAGKKETNYLNVNKKGSNLYVYDRKALLEKLEAEGAGKPSEYDDAPYTRVERRVKPDRPISELHKCQNPLTDLHLLDIEAGTPPEEEHHWHMFQDSCRYRGLAGALNRLPDGLRDQYEEAVAKDGDALWQPNKLWKHWPDALQVSGIMPSDNE